MNGGSVADSGLLRRLTAPTYFIAALLVVLPLLDFATNVWPPQPGQAVWRYGAVGLFSGFVLTPLLGLLVATAMAAVSERGLVLRVLGWLSLAVAGVFLVGVVLFVLDSFQVRASVPPEGKAQFDVGIWRAVVKYLLASPAVGWLGMAATRAGRQALRTRPSVRNTGPAVLHAPQDRR